jgi:FkbM family methyltransferase
LQKVDLTFFDVTGGSHKLALEFDSADFVQSDIWRSLKAGIFYEHETSKTFLQIIRPGDVFFDIGANVGYFALLGGKLVGERGRVVAFEANPSNCAALTAAAQRNHLDIVLESVAVSDRVGTAMFRDQGEGDCNGGLFNGEKGGNVYEVKTITLDAYMAQSGMTVPKVMKIDVEGAELQVLNGGSKLFANEELEFVICEFNVPQLLNFGARVSDIVNFMADRGLFLYLIDNEGGLPRFVPPGVGVRMTSVANVMFCRHTAIAKYWPEVVNECYVYCLHKKKSG